MYACHNVVNYATFEILNQFKTEEFYSLINEAFNILQYGD